MSDNAQEDLISETPDQDTPPPPAFHAVVNADLFRRAQMCVATKDPTRHFLAGVRIEPCPEGGAIMVSTNGHHMVVIRDPHAIVKGAGIVRLNKLMTRALKAEKSDLQHSERALLVSYEPDTGSRALVASIAVEDRFESRELAFDLFDRPSGEIRAVQYEDVLIDGEYPDWRRVVPSYAEAGQSFATFNPNLIDRVAQALAPQRDIVPTLTFYTDPNAPTAGPILVKGALFQHSDETFQGFGIIMTYRGQEPDASAPEWARVA